jgi:hypothetical protein
MTDENQKPTGPATPVKQKRPRNRPDGRGREPAGILAEQCDQHLLEITGGGALQVENREAQGGLVGRAYALEQA